MKRSKLIPVMVAVVFATFLALSSVLTLHAQQVGEIKRTVLTKQDLSAPGREGILTMAELAPGAREARHTHPGELFVYVQEGTITASRSTKSTYAAPMMATARSVCFSFSISSITGV